jgi:hypothetical protein
VCAVTRAGELYHTIRFAADGHWQDFFGDVAGQEGNQIGAVAYVGCATNQAGDLHVCTVTRTGQLYHTIRFADGHWQDFFGDVQGETSQVGPPIAAPLGPVECCTSANGDLHVSVVTKAIGQKSDGQLWYTFRHADSGKWSDFDYVQQQLNVIGPVLVAGVTHN